MQGKKILLGITGSIAAYKIPQLVRLLLKEGAEVQVICTPSAKDFVSTLVLSTLSQKPVLVNLFDESTWANHVMLGRWADIMLIAPASTNSLAKMATGICDNMLLATYLSATCPVCIAPAMDDDMWHHPTTQNNFSNLQKNKVQIIPATHGELASGLIGMGRMAELDDIVGYLSNYFITKNKLHGKTAIVTAGPTYENIDPVRFIGNYSSGKMGIAIAEELASQGAMVDLILGPTHLTTTHRNINIHRIKSASDMYTIAIEKFSACDIAVMAAAVADYTPIEIATNKIKKTEESFSIELSKTKDILKHLGSIKKPSQILIGFALETTNEEHFAIEKLKNKNADAIILNSLNDSNATFGHDTNKITIFDKHGNKESFNLKSKTEVAKDVVAKICALGNF